MCARFPTRLEEDKERQGPKAVDRKGVSRREQSIEVRKRRLISEELGPVDQEARLSNLRGWVSIPGGFEGISLEYTLAIAHKWCIESYRKVLQASPSLRLELTQVCVCFFFSSTLSVVHVESCVFVKQCEMPLTGDERNHLMIGSPWAGLGGWDSGDRPAGIFSHIQGAESYCFFFLFLCGRKIFISRSDDHLSYSMQMSHILSDFFNILVIVF